MDIKIFLITFITIFMAELGDKTQIATFLYASDRGHSKVSVFLGASLALLCTTALAVILGNFVGKWLSSRYVTLGSGVLFILVGIWIIIRSLLGSS